MAVATPRRLDSVPRMMNCGIYELSSPNGRYIGSSARIRARVARHKFMLRNGRHYNPKLQAAFNKHGDLVARTLIVCARNDLIFYEQLCIDGLAPEYNLNSQANRVDWTPEMREREGARHRGKVISPEHLAKIGAFFRGKKLSAEHVERVRAASVGRNVGRKHTPETRAKMSAAHVGKALSVEHRAKIGANSKVKLKGRKLSAASIAKRTATRLARGWNKRERGNASDQ